MCVNVSKCTRSRSMPPRDCSLVSRTLHGLVLYEDPIGLTVADKRPTVAVRCAAIKLSALKRFSCKISSSPLPSCPTSSNRRCCWWERKACVATKLLPFSACRSVGSRLSRRRVALRHFFDGHGDRAERARPRRGAAQAIAGSIQDRTRGRRVLAAYAIAAQEPSWRDRPAIAVTPRP
jgi:hypothetical protein